MLHVIGSLTNRQQYYQNNSWNSHVRFSKKKISTRTLQRYCTYEDFNSLNNGNENENENENQISRYMKQLKFLTSYEGQDEKQKHRAKLCSEVKVSIQS